MATPPPPPRNLKIGKIVDTTLGVLERAAIPALIYVAVLTVVSSALTYFAVTRTSVTVGLGVTLVTFVVGITAAYLLLDRIVRDTGLRTRTADDVFFAFFGLTLLSTLGVGLGLIALVLPGLVIWARWIVAPTMMIARGDGVMQALGNSWERTKGNEVQILGAMLALFVLPILVLVVSNILFEDADPIGIVISQIASSGFSTVSMAMGVAIYGMLERRAAAGTFE